LDLHTPNYFSAFRCLADRCPHTCCAWWEVPVDPAAAAFYRALPGETGDALRAALTADDAGGACFRLTGGVCPFLDGKGLCSLQLRWGEDKIPAICREHPRFSYDYGPVREVGLCASCPEVARLVLDTPPLLSLSQIPDAGEAAPPLLSPLLAARQAAWAILLTGDLPLPDRLRGMLLLLNEVQVALDEDAPEAVGELCQVYLSDLPLLDPDPLPQREEALKTCLELLRGLVLLTPEWRDLLDRALAHPAALTARAADPAGARMAAYFLYRHLLRGVWDADPLTWGELALIGALIPAALAPLCPEGLPETFRLFCLEIEHAQCDLDALQDALRQLPLALLLALTK